MMSVTWHVRILVRAHVIDYESIPQFLVITKGKDFRVNHGQFNVKCYNAISLVGSLKMRILPLAQATFRQEGLLISLASAVWAWTTFSPEQSDGS